jgi:hypothetical protein
MFTRPLFTRPLALPPPHELPWPLKPFDSAKTSVTYDKSGRLVLQIWHDILKGLTPEMVSWWFSHIGGQTVINDKKLDKYLAWHPRDHIHWALARPGRDGGASVGAQFRIVEAFDRNPDYYLDVIDTVVRLDSSGFTGVSYSLGMAVSNLNHDFAVVSGGTRYVSRLTVGATTPVLAKPLNALVRPRIFSEAMSQAWFKHNVEEVGFLEHLVPHVIAESRGDGLPRG